MSRYAYVYAYVYVCLYVYVYTQARVNIAKKTPLEGWLVPTTFTYSMWRMDVQLALILLQQGLNQF